LRADEYLDAAFENPNGVILISLHIGNWEVATMAAALATGRRVTSVARPLGLPWADRWISAIRTRFGNRIIAKDGALKEMNRTLRSGGILGILIDQVTKRSDGVEVRFFGRRVMATPAAALLALRCRSTVIPAFCARDRDDGLVLHFRPPLAIHRSGDLRRDIAINTQRMNDAIVEIIEAYPSQWFWFHKRWKRFYPDLYPEYQAKRRRKRKRELKALKKAGIEVADPQAYIDNL
jgi:KDO2-lipid IV(A) lauroyltransferase